MKFKWFQFDEVFIMSDKDIVINDIDAGNGKIEKIDI